MEKTVINQILAVGELINDIIPAVLLIEKLKDGTYVVTKRNFKKKIIKGEKRLYLYLGWLLSHDSLIK